MLNIKDNMITAANRLKKSVAMMAKYRLPPYPMNYTLCYAYVSEHTQAYCSEMKSILEEYGTCPGDLAQSLYERYFRTDRSTSGQEVIQKSILAETDKIIDDMADLGREIDSFDQILGGVIDDADFIFKGEIIHPALTLLVEQTELFKQQVKSHHQSMENANETIRSLKQQLLKDDLTDLFNRRMFDATMDGLIFNEKTPTVLSVFDIDNFKKINDLYGHTMGDAIIKKVGEIVEKTMPAGSICMRLGGDEFAIFFKGFDLEDAESACEKLRVNMKKLYVRNKSGKPKALSVSLSIGITQLRAKESADDFFERADQLMYMAKESGKNLVVRG